MRNDLAIMLLATLVSYPIGLGLCQPWLLPLLNALPAYIVLVHRLRAKVDKAVRECPTGAISIEE